MAKKRLFGSRWEILGSLGEGGQARVFRVRDRRDGSTGWVLKRLKNSNRLGRFEREVQALRAVRSDHILPIEDFDLHEPAFLVTPLVGRDLVKCLQGRQLGLLEALSLFEQMVVAVRDAHEVGVAHRDLKPNNVVVSDQGTAFVIDFGLCQVLDGDLVLTTTGELIGTAAFAAPECAPGSARSCGPSSDVYSLGKLLYWLVSGGSLIHREAISDAVVEGIRHPDQWARHYVAGILRGTVLEDPGRRWSAMQLLERVRVVMELVRGLEQRTEAELVTLWDGFWVNDAYERSSSRSATTPGRGNPPSDQDLATAFTVPEGTVVRLEELSLALSLRAGQDRLEVKILGDQGTVPDDSSVLEAFTIVGRTTREGEIVTLRSETTPLLVGGSRFWVSLSVEAADSEVAWLSGAMELMPLRALIAERWNRGPWNVGDSRAGPGYALRVLGRQREKDGEDRISHGAPGVLYPQPPDP
jgi:serine/threonine protein kinase